jgi:hypothetical protein
VLHLLPRLQASLQFCIRRSLAASHRRERLIFAPFRCIPLVNFVLRVIAVDEATPCMGSLLLVRVCVRKCVHEQDFWREIGRVEYYMGVRQTYALETKTGFSANIFV